MQNYPFVYFPRGYFLALNRTLICRAEFTASKGLPDLGLIYSNEVARHAQQIIKIVQLPLLVDIDTGFGGVSNVARTLVSVARKDAAAIERIKCNVVARAAAIFPEALTAANLKKILLIFSN